jgi:hypothetical protein
MRSPWTLPAVAVVVLAAPALAFATRAPASWGTVRDEPAPLAVAARTAPLSAGAVRDDATPPCFGAAARDPAVPCVNRALNRIAIPSPYDAPLEPSEPCTRIERTSPPACAFGAPASMSARSVALMGDSHSTHWRAAIAYLARERRWHGVSLNRSLCPFTLAMTTHRARCRGWTRGALRWLRNHPEVRSLFVSANAGSGTVAARGQSRADAKIDGYLRAWKAIPRSVREVFVLRDVPHSGAGTAACVTRAVARHRNPAVRCQLPRRHALLRDLEAVAADENQTDRIKVVDLSSLMCDEQSCLPVVGGALVIKDLGHMTRTFSRTLGPYLGQAIDRLRG